MLEIERENEGDATGIMPWQTDADLVKRKLYLIVFLIFLIYFSEIISWNHVQQ